MSPLPLDKVAHGAGAGFALLAALVLGAPLFAALSIVGGAVLLWEFAREWRHPDSWWDLLADALGMVAALWVWGVRP